MLLKFLYFRGVFRYNYKIMKRRFFVSVLLTFGALLSMKPCTNFLIGKNASVDGSTMVSYSADSYMLYGALYHYPVADYDKDATLSVYEWDTGKYMGEIAQAAHTYNVVGNMNEHQLCIAETTFGGREELIDTTAILDYGSLIYITLQRAKTAREAIEVMTTLVQEYGFASSGESFSIADPNEVWILEMIGKGVELKKDRKGNWVNKNKGAVWVAVRVPDDCISAHANQARITTIDFSDKENVLYAPDVISFAKKQGYFSGAEKDFSFSDVYNPLDFGGIRFCEARVWAFFRKISPEIDKYISYIKGETKERMPLWIKPQEKVSCEFIKECMRDHYEGTELDMTTGLGAGCSFSPFRKSPLTWMVDSVEYFHERPIATQQTGFSFVGQMRGWLPNPIGGILWFGVDDATFNVYVPMYCSITKVPWCFDINNGSLLDFSWTSAFWIYNWVANMAYPNYSEMSLDIRAEQDSWAKRFDLLVEEADAAALKIFVSDKGLAINYLTEFSNNQAEESTLSRKKMGEYLMVKYLDGVLKVEKDKKFTKNDKNIPPTVVRPGYTESYNRNIVNENKERFRYKSQEELKNRK